MSESKTPRTDAIAHAGYEAVTYIGRMTALARDLERENAHLREALREIAEDPANAVTYFEDKWRTVAKTALMSEDKLSDAGRRLL